MATTPASPRTKAQCVTRERGGAMQRLATSLVPDECWINRAAAAQVPTRGPRRAGPARAHRPSPAKPSLQQGLRATLQNEAALNCRVETAEAFYGAGWGDG